MGKRFHSNDYIRLPIKAIITPGSVFKSHLNLNRFELQKTPNAIGPLGFACSWMTLGPQTR